jgi:CheY-like chemotaxis protein
MPVMDGLEATRLIRGRVDADALPIIAMTAHALEEERQQCLAAGMNDHLTKPVDPKGLTRTLARWVHRVRPSTS